VQGCKFYFSVRATRKVRGPIAISGQLWPQIWVWGRIK